jgi:hypothetical protein
MNPNIAASSGHTTIIHRRNGDTIGYREVTDEAARTAVRAFPFASASAVAKTGKLGAFGAYLLCGGAQIYVGESRDPGRRLTEHAADEAKSFAKEVYVIAAFDGPPLDRPSIQYLQARLTEVAEAARRMEVVKGVAPCTVDLHHTRIDTLEHMLADAFRLLYDAGCRTFEGCESPRAQLFGDGSESDADEDLNDTGSMKIGVAGIPAGVQEFELRYTDGITARGYASTDGFVVVAGSEFRASVNESAQRLTADRHRSLKEKGLLEPISGVKDRLRLVIAVDFPTMATAAKTVCGAHVGASKWCPLQPPPVVVVN